MLTKATTVEVCKDEYNKLEQWLNEEERDMEEWPVEVQNNMSGLLQPVVCRRNT